MSTPQFVTELSNTIEQTIDAMPHAKRLYPDTYAAEVATALMSLITEAKAEAWAEGFHTGWGECLDLGGVGNIEQVGQSFNPYTKGEVK